MTNIPFSQRQRILQFEPPFPDKQYSLLLSLRGKEGLSMLYDYELEIITTNNRLTAVDVLGKLINFSLINPQSENKQAVRQFHGMIIEFVIGDHTVYFKANQELNCRRYFLRVAPALWLLTKSEHNRVFQRTGQNVIDIVQMVLKPYALKIDTSQVVQAPLWEYCTQYNESDFDFFTRILAQTGIYYYFKQQYNEHLLVLANSNHGYTTSAVKLHSSYDSIQSPAVTSFSAHYQMTSGNFAVANADIEQGNTGLFYQQSFKGLFELPLVTQKTTQFVFPALMKTNTDGQFFTQIAADRTATQSHVYQVSSDYSELKASSLIEFTGKYYADLPDKEYVITYLEFSATDERGNYQSTADTYDYHNQFIAIPKSICFRPLQPSKPNPGYFQLATIVNSNGKTSGEQPIHTDKYGQHSIKFIWEDNPTNQPFTNMFDQCRVRVLNNWDNGNYRVGTPVIIGFIDADIDKPIILGAVNDALNLLQGEYTTANQFTSIIKRYPGSDDGRNYNAISFNDKQDQELLQIFAGKDLKTVVNKGNRVAVIKTGDDHYLLKQGKEIHQVKQGERMVTIGGNETHQSQANYDHFVTDNYYLEVKGNLVIKANGNLDLRSQGKITLNGNELTANINTAANINSQNTTINSRTTTNIKGLSINIDGPTGVKIN